MDPILGMAAISAVGGIAQLINGQIANAKNAEDRARLSALLAKVQQPNFDFSQLKAPEFRVLQQYVPQVAEYVAEKNPQLVKANSEDAVAGRDAQRAALQRLRGLSDTGRDAQSDALQEDAMARQQQTNNSQLASIRQQMQQRGMGGSGNELAMSLSAQQNSAQLGAEGSRDAALSSYRTRLQALKDSANLGADIRQDDVNLESKNADINNSFNQRLAANLNTYNQNRDAVLNDGQRVNIGQNQSAADRTSTATYNTSVQNQSTQNDLRQRQYDNELKKLGLETGQTNQGVSDRNAATTDRNNAISGLGDAAMTGLAYSQRQKKEAPIKYDDDENDPTFQGPGQNSLNRRYK